MGLTSILLRLPFAAIATALGGGRMLSYHRLIAPSLRSVREVLSD